MAEDILSKAKGLLGSAPGTPRRALSGEEIKALPGRAVELLDRKGSLDVYIAFDTTGSMSSYITEVKINLGEITNNLLQGDSDIRLSFNGIGDHCDGKDWLQMYALTNNADEAKGSIEEIAGTYGGDEPEAYECLALNLAQRIPTDSLGRKRAVVLVGDSLPHGIIDEPCEKEVDYQKAFEAMRAVCDSFYFVGCESQHYAQQRKLVDPAKGKFIPLGSMTNVLPSLLVALAKKSESKRAYLDYIKQLESRKNPELAGKVRGLLGNGD